MKILKNIVLFLTIIAILAGCSNRGEDNNKEKEKIIEEMAYIDTKIVDMLNEVNNILLENYEITSKEIEVSKESESVQSVGSEGENSKTQSSSQAQNSESQGSSQGENSDENSLTVFEISQKSILDDIPIEIKWDKIKTDIERVNTSWNVLLLDLYSLNNSNETIEGFGNALNNCIIAIKNEDKIATITNLSTLYNFLPQILNDISSEKEIRIVKQTKGYVLSAYSYANQNNWEMVAQELTKAENEFLKIMNNMEFIEDRQNKINSVYIGIKELQKSLSTQEIKVFFMNYKNLVEKINIL